RHTALVGDLADPFDDHTILGHVEHLAELVGLGPGGRLVPLAREAPASERTPRDHSDALVGAEWHHLALLLAVEEVVVVLHADELGPAVGLGDVLRLAELPGPHRRRADVARLAGLD